MSWCAHGLTAVSVREYVVNVEARLGMRLQPIRSPKDFLTVERAAFMWKPPLAVVQLRSMSAKQSSHGKTESGTPRMCMPGYTPIKLSCYLPDNVAPALQNVPIELAAPYKLFQLP
jgi:hypothetical protein